jgi:hypothetical protein
MSFHLRFGFLDLPNTIVPSTNNTGTAHSIRLKSQDSKTILK